MWRSASAPCSSACSAGSESDSELELWTALAAMRCATAAAGEDAAGRCALLLLGLVGPGLEPEPEPELDLRRGEGDPLLVRRSCPRRSF